MPPSLATKTLFMGCWCRERLFSASKDGIILAWAVRTWAAVARVEAYDFMATGEWPRCLTAS